MIEYTLAVTSPFTVSDEVGYAQSVLNGNNVFKNDWHRGPINHVFGTETGRSCVRGKYWIGYPDSELDPTYGPTFDAYLTGEAELTPQMLARISTRMNQAQNVSIGEKMFAEATKHLGKKERTGHNDIWVTDWYGVRGAWCAMFVSYCGVKVGSKTFAKGLNPPSHLHPGSGTYDYVPWVVADALHGINGLQVITAAQVKRGDLVCYDWDGGVADHIGFFDQWVEGKTYFKSVEGNTSPDNTGNQSNGGGVFRRGENPHGNDTRKITQVERFVRVGR